MTRRTLFHVSPSVNRASILARGLDPRWMGAARGIAGSEWREIDGVFVCPDREAAEFFLTMARQQHLAVDLWAIDDPGSALLTSSRGFEYLPAPVPAERVRLVESFAATADQQP